jgi:hypothetical protein
MSCLTEIRKMIEERISAQPELRESFAAIHARVIELERIEQQLRIDHQNLCEDYQNLFVQFNSQAKALAEATSETTQRKLAILKQMEQAATQEMRACFA